MLSPVILLITKADYGYPLVLMAAIAAYRLLRFPQQTIKTNQFKWLTVLFLLLWLPMLASLPDAVNPAHSASTVYPYIRFYFAGVFFLQELNKPAVAEKFFTGLFIIISCWVIDALIQLLFGKNLLGYPDNNKGLTGLFYPKTRIGHVLAVFSPLYFDYLRTQLRNKPIAIFLFLGLLAVVLLSGKRVAWIMLFFSIFTTLAFLIMHKGKKALGSLLIVTISILAVLYITAQSYAPLAKRLEHTSGLFSTDYDDIDKASARRLSLWQISINTGKENWLNGIGPRGFRHVISQYAEKDNFWVQNGRMGSTHPHQFVLEIFAETGTLGLLAYLLALSLLIKLALSHWNKDNPHCFPAFLAVLIALLPINSHLAFYGSYWSTILWLLLPIFISSCRNTNK